MAPKVELEGKEEDNIAHACHSLYFQSTDIREDLTMAAGRYSQLVPLAACNEDKFHDPPSSSFIHSMGNSSSAPLTSGNYGIVKPPKGPIRPDPPVNTPKHKSSRNDGRGPHAKDYKLHVGKGLWGGLGLRAIKVPRPCFEI